MPAERPMPFPYRRVNVVGTSASGKTQVAMALARKLGVPHVELDALHWEPNWTHASDEAMRDRVAAMVATDGWVVDGNYSVVRGLIWERVEAVVWLDYSLATIMRRYLIRTVRRIRTQEEIWPGTGNRERWSMQLRRDGLPWWILSTYRRRRRDYPRLLAARHDIAVIRLRNPGATAAWLAQLDAQ
jgi:adenylate kinase family enzyme